MSRTNDTYEQALKDASVALNALADKAYAAAESLRIDNVGFDAYDFKAYCTAVDRHNGICSAVLEIYGLLERHRSEREAGAA